MIDTHKYELSGYQLNEQIYESTLSVIFKGIDLRSNSGPVVVKFYKSNLPTKKEIEKIEHEYHLLKKLNIPGIIKAYALENYGNNKVIVMEDFGGVSLNEYLKNHKLDITEFLEAAIDILVALEETHKNDIIHKDIKPHNILINEKTKEIKFIDFGIACLVKREIRHAVSAEKLEGTLSYIAPEQTGRMNRSIDFRTDYYSLGVTFYEILTGRLPFEYKDPLELIHAHIAKSPVKPSAINPNIPEVISDIILKMMAKNAEDRYQSGKGIRSDLEKCLDMLKKNNIIKPFTLCEEDISDTLHIPEKLYGRSESIEILLNKFAAASLPEAKPAVVFISGVSGIGKSSIINEIQKPMLEKKGYFITGKYDVFRKSTPFSAIIAAFRDLIDMLLSESESALETWKNEIMKELGENSAVILDVVPQLKLVIGEQPQAPELSPEETENRFGYVFQNFTKAFAKKEHPLVLFLDDLQWVDSASLRWLSIILRNTGLSNFMLVGAYRDNEVNNAHPLILLLEELKKEGIQWDSIALEPLTAGNISQLLSEALFKKGNETDELAEIVKAKTGGNPFFVNEFIKSLYENNMVRFDNGWKWEINKIKEAQITANVVEFMAEKVKKLSKETRNIMQIASCAGIKFYYDTLCEICGKTEDETFEILKPAINEGMIINLESGACFAHDRVREAVYSILSEDEKINYHYSIGRILLKNSTKEQLEDRIFHIVNQLNFAISKINDPQERIDLAQLNLRTGIKAKQSTAYESACRLFEAGISLLPSNSWSTSYNLTLSLYSEEGEVTYLVGRHEDAERYFSEVLTHAKDPLDKVRVFSIQIPLKTVKNEMGAAMEDGRKALALLGVHFPKKANPIIMIRNLLKVKGLQGKKKVQDLLDLPEVTDPKKLAISRLLMQMVAPAYISFPDIFPIVILMLLGASLKNGNSEYAVYAYVTYGLILGSFLGDIHQGYEFGELALKLEKKFNAKAVTGKVNFLFGNFIRHQTKPMRESMPFLERGYIGGFESGDLIIASYCINHNLAFSIFSGENLEIAKEKGANYFDIIRKFKQIDAVYAFKLFYQVAVNLSTKQADKYSLSGELFNENEIIPEWVKIKNWTDMGFYNVCKQLVHYLYGDYKSAIRYAEEGKKYLSSVMGMIYPKEHNYYYSLSLIGNYASVGQKEQKEYLKIIKANQKKLKQWADLCPENCMHKYLFVEAELSAQTGPMKETMQLYDRAINEAQKNGFINEEAIMMEHASLYYQSIGSERIAVSYLKESITAFQNWGAVGKLQDIREKYPSLFPYMEGAANSTFTTESTMNTMSTMSTLSTLSTVSSKSTTSSSSGSMNALDLGTVMKAASAISGEIVMDKLIGSLITMVMENAGAQKVVLLLNKDNKFFIEAMGTTESREIQKFDSAPYEDSKTVPESVIRFTARTKESIVLNNAAKEGAFTRDIYIQDNQVRSALCAPIINKSSITGILYLENNLSDGAFSKERLQMINILSGQMGISIDNASLYERLEDYSKNLENMVEERTQQLKIAHKELSKSHETMKKELKVARTIQRSLIPTSFPSFNAVSIGGNYLPMEDLGGDFYDVFNVDNTHIGFVIADVSGHGVPAALITSMAKISFTTNSVPGRSAGNIVSRVNKELCTAIEDVLQYMTAFYCIIDVQTGKMEYCNAGHGEILIVRNKKDIIVIGPNASIIGKYHNYEYATGSVKIEKGDKIVFFTDGIPEARNSQLEFYTLERLEADILALSSRSVSDMVTGIIDRLRAFIGEYPAQDDITLLIAEILSIGDNPKNIGEKLPDNQIK
jgi:predicted ATPase/serine phosphatase RsbU (regulator of sigma subunit)/tRNA A-37 threonylcarbamoyl transferase component Bud32